MPPHQRNRETYGGMRADQPPGQYRWFDDKRRVREVRVSIRQYMVHYYVTLREEDNPAWDEAEQTWRVCWDDPPEVKGREESTKKNTWDEARAWADRTFRRFVRKKGARYKLVYDRSALRKTWFYAET